MSAVTNVRWVGAIQGARVGVQLLSLLILSRLLSPADFGLAALAFAISNFALLIRDLGTGAAVIQKATLDRPTVLTAHWSNCVVGVMLGFVLFALAPTFAGLLDAPDAAPLLRVLALSFPVLGSTAVHQALLERESRFALLARIEIIAMLTGFIVALTAALLGAGAYSLVAQTLAVAVVSAAQLWLATELRCTWCWSRAHMRELWAFSGRLLGFNVVNYFTRNADVMIIGRVLGPAMAGSYSLAYRVMLFPLQNLTFVATRALLPVMSRAQDAPERLGEMYLRVLSAIAFFTAPLMAGLFVLREPLVAIALGDSWSEVSAIIAWLAPVGLVQSLVSVGGAVFTALGRTDVLFRLGVFGAVLHVAAFALGASHGVTGVAASYLVAATINGLLCFQVLLRLLKQPLRRLPAALAPAMAKALIMAIAIHFADAELAALSASPLLRLVVCTAGGAAIYLALTRAHLKPSDRDVLRLLMRKA